MIRQARIITKKSLSGKTRLSRKASVNSPGKAFYGTKDLLFGELLGPMKRFGARGQTVEARKVFHVEHIHSIGDIGMFTIQLSAKL